MAKRYDTPEDFERDVLKEQAGKVRLASANQALSGFSWMIFSAIPEWIRQSKPEGRGWLSLVSMGMTLVGAIEVIRSMFTSSKARDLDMKRERLGPEQVVLPADMTLPSQEPECGCKLKNFTHSIGHQTLLEQAAKTDQPVVRA